MCGLLRRHSGECYTSGTRPARVCSSCPGRRPVSTGPTELMGLPIMTLHTSGDDGPLVSPVTLGTPSFLY